MVSLILDIFTESTERLVLDFFLCVCVFLGLYPQHMEVPRLGVDSEL